MLMSANGLEFTEGHLDLAFTGGAGWEGDPDHGFQTLTFTLGDPARGPMVALFNMRGRPGDEEKFPPIIHMHRSDSFRTILNSDFYVGRELYADGRARLQRGGRYYGPEQLGPNCCRNSENAWALLVFGDKRGHKLHPVDEIYMERVRRGDALDDRYRLMGVEPFPMEDKGRSDIRTNVGLKVAAHGDLGFDQASSWPLLGQARVAVMAIGETDCGPLVLALAAPPGAQALPALTADTELLTCVVAGEARLDGAPLAPGAVRVQDAGVRQPPLIAGPEGLSAYLVIADRRAALRPDAGDPGGQAWIEALGRETASFRTPKPEAASRRAG